MSLANKSIYLLGSASGVAAADAGCHDGPLVLKQSPYLSQFLNNDVALNWGPIFETKQLASGETMLAVIAQHCKRLAEAVADAVNKKAFFTVFGGDHSCAIGTWSGVYSRLGSEGPIGLIWIDAHMDSHTPETSETGNIHGMPLACLLGQGDHLLTHLLDDKPKLLPQHVCLIGVRSFESGEAALLKQLNVRVFFMDEVKQRGLEAVMKDALAIATRGTVGYGVSLDLDSIDPIEAPGTGVGEPGGLSATELCQALRLVANDSRLIGAEIVEFDPHLDKNHATEKLVGRLLAAIVLGKTV